MAKYRPIILYSLAKKLKDLGFKYSREHDEGDYCYSHCFFAGYEREKRIHSPNLSELIEACGLEIILSHYESGWAIKKYIHDIHGENIELEWFDTPEEAVAHLYLELNKKT